MFELFVSGGQSYSYSPGPQLWVVLDSAKVSFSTNRWSKMLPKASWSSEKETFSFCFMVVGGLQKWSQSRGICSWTAAQSGDGWKILLTFILLLPKTPEIWTSRQTEIITLLVLDVVTPSFYLGAICQWGPCKSAVDVSAVGEEFLGFFTVWWDLMDSSPLWYSTIIFIFFFYLPKCCIFSVSF